MKSIHFVTLAGALLLFSCGKKEDATATIPGTDTIPVKVVSLEKSSSSSEISVSGEFSTDDETYLSFLSGGIIQKIYVKEGDRIQKGQLLAVQDMTLAKAQLSQAKIGLEKAKRDLDRVKNLQQQGFATLEQLQNAQSALDLAKEQVESAQYAVSNSEIRAVSSGFILKKMASTGELVGSGSPVFLTNGAGSKSWKLKVGVNDRQWSSIEIGDGAVIESDVFNGRKIQGKVSRKAESIDPYSGTFTIELELLGEKIPTLASGIFGKAKITPSLKSMNWSIPYAALLDGNASEGFVFVTNDRKTVKKIPVKIAKLNQHSIEISSGLENYKYLIVSGSAYLSENSIISIP